MIVSIIYVVDQLLLKCASICYFPSQLVVVHQKQLKTIRTHMAKEGLRREKVAIHWGDGGSVSKCAPIMMAVASPMGTTTGKSVRFRVGDNRRYAKRRFLGEEC